MSEQEFPKIAMTIVAHPDDAEFGCAGAVAGWVREGWEVYFVICTDASGGGADDATDVGPAARKKITDIRKAEQHEAAQILGVKDVIFLDWPDGVLQPSIDLRRDLVRVMRRYKPTRVLCQSPERSWKPAYPIGRYHPDHLAAAAATIAALYPACQNAWDFPELLTEGLLPHKVRELYVMGAPEINYAVDITATFDTKLAALAAHDSQLGTRMAELEPRLREWAAEAGKAYGMQYAEVFHRTENW